MASNPLEYIQERIEWLRETQNNPSLSLFSMQDGDVKRMWSKNTSEVPITKEQFHKGAEAVFHLDVDGNPPEELSETQQWNGSDYLSETLPLSQTIIDKVSVIHRHILKQFQTEEWDAFFISEAEKAELDLSKEEDRNKFEGMKGLLVGAYFFKLCGLTKFSDKFEFSHPKHEFFFSKIIGDNYTKAVFAKFNKARSDCTYEALGSGPGVTEPTVASEKERLLTGDIPPGVNNFIDRVNTSPSCQNLARSLDGYLFNAQYMYLGEVSETKMANALYAKIFDSSNDHKEEQANYTAITDAIETSRLPSSSKKGLKTAIDAIRNEYRTTHAQEITQRDLHFTICENISSARKISELTQILQLAVDIKGFPDLSTSKQKQISHALELQLSTISTRNRDKAAGFVQLVGAINQSEKLSSQMKNDLKITFMLDALKDNQSKKVRKAVATTLLSDPDLLANFSALDPNKRTILAKAIIDSNSIVPAIDAATSLDLADQKVLLGEMQSQIQSHLFGKTKHEKLLNLAVTKLSSEHAVRADITKFVSSPEITPSAVHKKLMEDSANYQSRGGVEIEALVIKATVQQ